MPEKQELFAGLFSSSVYWSSLFIILLSLTLLPVLGSGRTELLSSLFQDRSISPNPTITNTSAAAQDKEDNNKTCKDQPNDRDIADILLAAELEDEMEECDGEDVFEEIFDDENKTYIENNDEPNRNLVPKPKRKMELKAGLLKEILFNKPKRHTFSGLYM